MVTGFFHDYFYSWILLFAIFHHQLFPKCFILCLDSILRKIEKLEKQSLSPTLIIILLTVQITFFFLCIRFSNHNIGAKYFPVCKAFTSFMKGIIERTLILSKCLRDNKEKTRAARIKSIIIFLFNIYFMNRILYQGTTH